MTVSVPHPDPLPDPPLGKYCHDSKKNRRERKEKKPLVVFPLMYECSGRKAAEQLSYVVSATAKELTRGKEKSLLTSHGSHIVFPISPSNGTF